jgi:hypothetical protein
MNISPVEGVPVRNEIIKVLILEKGIFVPGADFVI